MRSISQLLILLLIIASCRLQGQSNCNMHNQAFGVDENAKYKIYYNWGALWMAAGEASFNVRAEILNNKSVFHFIGTGSTYSKYDWFYKVRDKYESFADTLTMRPLRFKRLVNEGPNHVNEDYVFNGKKNKVFTSSQKGNKTPKIDSIAIHSCTFDVLTAIYYCRNLDFKSLKVNDTIPIAFVLDGDLFQSRIKYLGKEVIFSEKLGNVRCIKFKPKLIEGTIFKGGEHMTVWVTDDENKMPVYVETDIIVGKVKVYLMEYSNLKNRLNCVITKPN
jgi:Protein of unknown function (DUF3108)